MLISSSRSTAQCPNKTLGSCQIVVSVDHDCTSRAPTKKSKHVMLISSPLLQGLGRPGPQVTCLIPGSGTPNNECPINRTNLKTTKLHWIYVQKSHPWLYSIFTNIIYHYFVISSRKHRAQLLVWETSFMEHVWSHECLDCLKFMIWKILEPKII